MATLSNVRNFLLFPTAVKGGPRLIAPRLRALRKADLDETPYGKYGSSGMCRFDVTKSYEYRRPFRWQGLRHFR